MADAEGRAPLRDGQPTHRGPAPASSRAPMACMEARAWRGCASPCSRCPLVCRGRPEGPRDARVVLWAR
eukprot:2076777-Pyramimonas_sp.AAC.1